MEVQGFEFRVKGRGLRVIKGNIMVENFGSRVN